MKSKLEKWLNYTFSSSEITGEDYLQFQKEAKAELKKMVKAEGLELHKFNTNHYGFSAVIKNESNNKYAYISITDVRYYQNKWWNHVLYRTMSHEKDWTGGYNQYCTWEEIGKAVKSLIS